MFSYNNIFIQYFQNKDYVYYHVFFLSKKSSCISKFHILGSKTVIWSLPELDAVRIEENTATKHQRMILIGLLKSQKSLLG